MTSVNTHTTFIYIHTLPQSHWLCNSEEMHTFFSPPPLSPYFRLILLILGAVSVKVSKSFKGIIYTTAMMMIRSFSRQCGSNLPIAFNNLPE